MKFSGTPAQLFQAIEDGTRRFQCIGQAGIPRVALLATGIAVAGAGTAISATMAERKQMKEIKILVKREVRKAVRPRQPTGISFDLFR